MAFKEDFSNFFSVNDFAVTAQISYYDDPDDKDEIDGIFDNNYQEITSDGEADVAGTNPVFLCRQSDISENYEKAVLSIENSEYEVINGEADGTGLILLILRDKI